MRRLTDKELLAISVTTEVFDELRSSKDRSWRGWMATLALRRAVAEAQHRHDLRFGLED
jgi:hypothetical protein